MASRLGAPTSVATSTTSAAIIAADTSASRKGVTVFNDSVADLYLNCGTASASATVFTVKVAAGGYWEAPFGYQGVINGVLSAGTGNARVSEFS